MCVGGGVRACVCVCARARVFVGLCVRVILSSEFISREYSYPLWNVMYLRLKYDIKKKQRAVNFSNVKRNEGNIESFNHWNL